MRKFKKKPTGRPPLPDDVRREVVTIRLPAAFLHAIKEECKRQEKSLGVVVETLLRSWLKRQGKKR
jgi:hypothetical protein